MPLTVNFADSSLSPVSTVNSWSWNFDDPFSGGSNTSSSNNPVHTFDSSGIYNVQLIIGTNWGCTDTVNVDVPVGVMPVLVEFSMSDTVACANQSVQFTDLSTDSINNWLWFFGDSTGLTSVEQNPSHAFTDTGTVIVTLIAGHNGCNDTVQHSLVIVPPKTVFIVSPAIGCTVPHLASFDDFSIGADTWLWDFGDGFTSTDTNTTHTYTAPGNYTVKLVITNANGCVDSGFAAVVIPDLQADFVPLDSIGCFSFFATFTNTSTYLHTPAITANSWTFGDGSAPVVNNANFSPTYLYNDTGTFDVMLVITDFYGCVDTMIKPQAVSSHGIYPNFSSDVTNGCAPLVVSFTDSTVGSLQPDSWSWDFGDGSPVDTTQNPVHVYTNAGTFSIQLTVADSNGCTDSITFSSLISTTRPSPIYTFDTPICIGQDLAIQNSSLGQGISYLWDFGDGDTASIANPLHGYADTGFYALTLIVTDSNGCDSTAVNIVDVSPSSTAGIVVDTLNTSCPPLVVSFQDSSSSDVVSWFWDFGDGSTSASENPIHTYSFPDTLDVMLAVANATGCVDTLILPDLIQIGGPFGTFSFIPDSGCVPLAVSFQANATNTSNYVWDFGDGVIDSVSGSSASHIYLNEGTPHPALILIDSIGCQQTAQPPDPDSILIDNPVALFASSTTLLYTTLCGLDTVYFFDASSVESPFTSLTSWSWDFGDGNTDTFPNPFNVYNDTGTYLVVLGVSSTLGCNKYDSLVITVEIDTINILRASIPVVTDVACGGGNSGAATGLALGGTAPYTYLWSDDSAQTTIQSTGLVAGTYLFSVIDSNGCTASDSTLISEPPALIATIFDSTMVTCNGLGDGTAEAIGTGGSGSYTYLWNDPSVQSSALATNLNVDTFTVTITDSLGCTAKDSVVITEPVLLTVIDASQNNVTCFGGSDGVAVSTTSGGTQPYTYLWNTTPIQTDTMIDSLSAGNYTVVVLDSFSCTSSITFTITEPPLLFSLIVDTTSILCFGDTTGEALISIIGGIPPYEILWLSVGDTGVTADSLWSGTHLYQVTDSIGCQITDSLWLSQPSKIDITINVGDGSICKYGKDSVQATAIGGTPPLTYDWDNGLGSGQAWKPLTPDTTTTYQLTVTDANNCNLQDSVQIFVFKLIKVAVSSDTLCLGDSIGLDVFIVEGGDSTYSYVWNFGDGVIDTTSDTSASHVYATIGLNILDLTVIGPDVCVTDSLVFDPLTILRSPIAGAFADPLVTNTVSPLISFTSKSKSSSLLDTLVSWFWDFGDQVNSSLVHPTHLYADSGTYLVSHAVINNFGCTDTSTLIIRINTSFEIEVPSGFTPDPTGANGGFYIPGTLDNNVFYPITRFVEDFHMMIFNRWGEMVFESFDIAVGWDGYYRGKLSQQDVYVWKIELRYIDGSEFKEIGDITLVR